MQTSPKDVDNKHSSFTAKIDAAMKIVEYIEGNEIIENEPVDNMIGKNKIKQTTRQTIINSVKNSILAKTNNNEEKEKIKEYISNIKTISELYNKNICIYIAHKDDEGFDNFVQSEDILGKLNLMVQLLSNYLSENTNEEINKLIYKFNNITVKTEKSLKDIRICPDCNFKMNILSNVSELRCDNCSRILQLEGVVFEETMFYVQNIKTREYNPNKHCIDWIKCIQTKEQKIIPQEVIDKIDELAIAHYTRNGKLRSMSNCTCSLVRSWLKSTFSDSGKKLTTYNNNAALIRKMVTSLHGEAVVPPQLTYEEEELLLHDFSRAMSKYDKIVKNKALMAKLGIDSMKSNKPYYPYGLFKILRMRYLKAEKEKNENEKIKYRKLIECIHIQSDNTIVDNDVIWKEICRTTPGFVYETTDRNLI